MAEAARTGRLAGPVDAKIQGPYDGHNMTGYEIDTFTHKLFLTGGVGIVAVLPILTRMALHMGCHQSAGTPHALVARDSMDVTPAQLT
jgi:hypothetical protein